MSFGVLAVDLSTSKGILFAQERHFSKKREENYSSYKRARKNLKIQVFIHFWEISSIKSKGNVHLEEIDLLIEEDC
ncbi:hypothetical protein HNY73_010451 [Argiope bruennichi]|uniref:Uncharacterized protein n=1 Tax=Argiope bruennichi TaxID=94029 RepID=A0A8T0F307_ARGBR|nr:hypothetical protein HNY73_010451 [Argiope bruennichi]